MIPVTYGYARVSKTDRDERTWRRSSKSLTNTACAEISSSSTTRQGPHSSARAGRS